MFEYLIKRELLPSSHIFFLHLNPFKRNKFQNTRSVPVTLETPQLQYFQILKVNLKNSPVFIETLAFKFSLHTVDPQYTFRKMT
jgi:hypothetical protein